MNGTKGVYDRDRPESRSIVSEKQQIINQRRIRS